MINLRRFTRTQYRASAFKLSAVTLSLWILASCAPAAPSSQRVLFFYSRWDENSPGLAIYTVDGMATQSATEFFLTNRPLASLAKTIPGRADMVFSAPGIAHAYASWHGPEKVVIHIKSSPKHLFVDAVGKWPKIKGVDIEFK